MTIDMADVPGMGTLGGRSTVSALLLIGKATKLTFNVLRYVIVPSVALSTATCKAARSPSRRKRGR